MQGARITLEKLHLKAPDYKNFEKLGDLSSLNTFKESINPFLMGQRKDLILEPGWETEGFENFLHTMF